MVRAEDNSVWQRVPTPNTSGLLALHEGETTTIEGTAEAGQPVQLFLFQYESGSATGMQKPADGTCFDAGIADANGVFRFPVNTRLLWGNIGDTLVVDAFTRLGKEWDQLETAKTDRNYLIGTHLPATVARVGIARQTADCQRFCPDSPYLIGTRIEPERFRHVAANAFPIASGSGNSSTAGQTGFTIAKLAPHTFYTLSDSSEPAYAEYLNGLAEKALAVEILKRHLVGLTGKGIPVGASLPNSLARTLAFLKSIDEDALARAVTGEGVSPEIASLARDLKDALVAPAGTATREQALDGLYAAFLAMMPDDVSPYTLPTRADIAAVFPPERPEETWRADLLDIFRLWTGDTEANRCLIPEANPELNFVTPPQTLHAVPMPEIGCLPLPSPTAGGNGGGLYQMQSVRVTGRDPVLVVRGGVESLKPKFWEVFLTKASIPFSDGQAWHLHGKAAEIAYHYRSVTPLGARTISEACLNGSEIAAYADALAKASGLPPRGAALIDQELKAGMVDPTLRHHIRLSDPSKIAERLLWTADGEPLQPARLFFEVKPATCPSAITNLPAAEALQGLQKQAETAYEIGLTE